MQVGDVVNMTHWTHYQPNIQASYRAPKGRVGVFLLLGDADKKAPESFDCVAAINNLGWFPKQETAATPPQPIYSALNFVCTALPGPGNECAFVELENDAGESLGHGKWRNRDDGLVELHIAAPQPIYDEAKEKEAHMEWFQNSEKFVNEYDQSLYGWLACAQSRAKAGEETP